MTRTAYRQIDYLARCACTGGADQQLHVLSRVTYERPASLAMPASAPLDAPECIPAGSCRSEWLHVHPFGPIAVFAPSMIRREA